MLSIREAIQGRINQGPANRVDLHAACMTQCCIGESGAAALWGMLTPNIAALEAEHRIVAHVSGCWMLPGGTQMETKEEAPTQKLRTGTVIPKNFQKLMKSKIDK